MFFCRHARRDVRRRHRGRARAAWPRDPRRRRSGVHERSSARSEISRRNSRFAQNCAADRPRGRSHDAACLRVHVRTHRGMFARGSTARCGCHRRALAAMRKPGGGGGMHPVDGGCVPRCGVRSADDDSQWPGRRRRSMQARDRDTRRKNLPAPRTRRRFPDAGNDTGRDGGRDRSGAAGRPQWSSSSSSSA